MNSIVFCYALCLDMKYEGQLHMEKIQELEMSSEGSSDGITRADMNGFSRASLEVLDHVKLNVEPETPVSILKGVLMSSKSDRSFSRNELKKAEALMTRAFVEFYQKLRLLKSYWYNWPISFCLELTTIRSFWVVI